MKKKLLYYLLLLTLPVVVFAKEKIGLGEAIFAELFCSIHMTVFVLWPLAMVFTKDPTKENVRKNTIKLFLVRAVILAILDMIDPSLYYIDFIAIFLGAFICIPLMIAKKAKGGKISLITNNVGGTGTISRIVGIPAIQNAAEEAQKRTGLTFAKPSEYDQIYSMNESAMLDTYITRELEKGGYNKKFIPFEMIKRRKVLNIIFVFLLFIYIVMIFFHFPLATYIIGLIILCVYFRVSRKFNIVKFINKEINARPSDNMKNIIASVMSNCTEDTNKSLLVVGTLVAIILPMIMFINPVILYEEVDDGYYVRYYAWGLKNYTTATIPKEHNGKPVVGLRGNTFSNMYYLESVELPDTIKVMRGQTFKNDVKLKGVKLPSQLEYLGGGAFYNCESLEGIVIPDSVTEIGGEAFYNCSNLKEVILPKNLKEIRGNTFEECGKLETIEIPSTVTRIGGHAFYNDYSLSNVIIREDSQLKEIGSSAFRRCGSLRFINLPSNVDINSRAFKESPTNVQYFDSLGNAGSKYKYYLNLSVGKTESFSINDFKETINVTLNDIEHIGSIYNYHFIITGAVNDKFTLNGSDLKEATINSNLSFEIDYYTANYVYLKAYYD